MVQREWAVTFHLQEVHTLTTDRRTGEESTPMEHGPDAIPSLSFPLWDCGHAHKYSQHVCCPLGPNSTHTALWDPVVLTTSPQS